MSTAATLPEERPMRTVRLSEELREVTAKEAGTTRPLATEPVEVAAPRPLTNSPTRPVSFAFTSSL